MDRSSRRNLSSWPPPWSEIHDERVLAAFRAVPRARFVPPNLVRWAHNDVPLPIGAGQTISQPFVVALMTQALALQPGERVLEIGTGSGYQTAILCELTAQPDKQPGATVFSVERKERLARRAAEILHFLGYAPHLQVGDGAAGWPQPVSFAAMIVTAAPVAIPVPLWAQLAEGGRMVLPMGAADEDQTLWLVRKQDDVAVGEPMGSVRFVPLVSPILDEPQNRVRIHRQR